LIRLGSLAGYPFEGPRLLAGWTPPAAAAVYVIAYKPEPETKPDKYAIIYVDHADDLSAERFPFQHPRAHCWIRRAGSKYKVYICTYEVPGGGKPHREQIARELIAIYRPRCNDQQYDQAWKDEWIGSSTASSPGLARDPQGRGPSGALPARDEAHRVEQARAARSRGRAGRFRHFGLLGPRGHAGHDVLGHPV
jgi:hypothetical protein